MSAVLVLAKQYVHSSLFLTLRFVHFYCTTFLSSLFSLLSSLFKIGGAVTNAIKSICDSPVAYGLFIILIKRFLVVVGLVLAVKLEERFALIGLFFSEIEFLHSRA